MINAAGHTPVTPFFEYRALCLRCLRAESVCYCSKIEKIATSFRIVLLQHPRERRNTIGTARLTHLCLTNSKLICGTDFDLDPEVNTILDDPGNECVVLFPGEKSTLLETSEDGAFAAEKNLVVFVIDGTWANAKSMMRKSSRLASLPQVRFNPENPSQYRIRKQPKPMCLSTVEAVHRLIRILNPETKADLLLELFASMVDQQIERAKEKNLRELRLTRA